MGKISNNNETAKLNKERIVCLPGQKLCVGQKGILSGRGTYELNGYIFASLAGIIKVKDQNDETKTISVVFTGDQAIVPKTGDVVIAQVTQITQRFAICSIISIGRKIIKNPCKGMLRRENIRATEKDNIEMFKCYRPSDIILARVLPQTELTSYQLTTAENELGVVIAKSFDMEYRGPSMVPISWTEMQCPQTLVKESRKVAKVVPERYVLIEEQVRKSNLS